VIDFVVHQVIKVVSIERSSRIVSFVDEKRAPLLVFDEHGDIPCPSTVLSVSSVEKFKHDHRHRHHHHDQRCPLLWKNCRAHIAYLFTHIFFSHFGLILVVILYIIIGGFMFSIIESKYETHQNEQIQNTYTHGIDHIRHIVNDEFNWMLNVSFELHYALWRGVLSRLDSQTRSDWYVRVHSERFDRLIDIELARMQIEREKFTDKHDAHTGAAFNQKWTYSAAMLYSATVITTVGYGNIAPESILGKMITCIYAMIGIPIMIMYLTHTGDLLAYIFIKYYSTARKWIHRYRFQQREEHRSNCSSMQVGYHRMLIDRT
jgi:hypothetical protein